MKFSKMKTPPGFTHLHVLDHLLKPCHKSSPTLKMTYKSSEKSFNPQGSGESSKGSKSLSSILEQLQSLELGDPKPSSKFIDTTESLAELLDSLHDLPTSPQPSIYVDMEGGSLSRNGTISILQMYISPRDEAALIDVHNLQNKAFSHASSKGWTLRKVLEDPSIMKVSFDVRNDSDALYRRFNVRLAGVHDLQLMELARRSSSKRYLSGLAKHIESHARLNGFELEKWKDAKFDGRKLFEPQLGGSYEVFNVRPLPDEVREYCVLGVRSLPKLWRLYYLGLTGSWYQRALEEAENYIRETQAPEYVSNGRSKVLGPVGW
ncbi:hypothetical protein P170DRAFT_484946 [Aspergillus steynii IBT 23096]|uniref:3'-5' exonuclease domain-containing protein n=1 Tax=Aspergillus steynii IBT 23096 TaxID=1392250 RepID=A0A2I2GSF9_9EURO|nr:uncharacterized protein P170DRAFT_484946 [Aspergillus steynii IBT 23096]PLB55809.1 hypothetical protein P170DRAFT_484946 [Aspergillus steynii IBT 23096]